MTFRRLATKWRTSRRVDVAVAAGLFVVAATLAMIYCASWGGDPLFWRNTTFMQAIMWVCGHGYENPMVSDVPGLAEFLDGQTDCFDCEQIPDDVRVIPHDTSGMTFDEIDRYHPQAQFPGFLPWQRYHLYLVWAALLCWSVLGVSWSALLPLAGVLYGATVATSYGLFRLGMHRGVALFCSIMLLISPVHLQMVPHIRDYSKAPFFLGTLLLAAYLIKKRRKWSTTLLSAAACGLILGLGIGFRTDVAIAMPLLVALLALFWPGALRATWLKRATAVGLLLAALVLTGLPILIEVFREAGHFCHVALLGLLRYCDYRLGVDARLYHLGNPYTDFYVANLVQSYVHRLHGVMPESHVMMPPYHEATQRYFAEYVWVFPGDLVFRAYTAVLRILDELRSTPGEPWPVGWRESALAPMFQVREFIAQIFLRGGRYAAGLAIVLLAAKRFRWGAAALLVVLYFAGYTAIQFNLRHTFHLEFISWWAAGFLVQQFISAAIRIRRPETRQQTIDSLLPWGRLGRRSWLRAGALSVAAVIGLSALLMGARAWQHRQVGQLVEAVANSEMEPPEVAGPVAVDGGARYEFARFEVPAEGALPTEYAYLAVECSGAPGETPITFRYLAENTEHFDYTRTVPVPLTNEGSTWLFFPLYYHEDARFVGAEIPDNLTPTIKGFYEVTGADNIPLWLTLRLPPNWADLPRYQSHIR